MDFLVKRMLVKVLSLVFRDVPLLVGWRGSCMHRCWWRFRRRFWQRGRLWPRHLGWILPSRLHVSALHPRNLNLLELYCRLWAVAHLCRDMDIDTTMMQPEIFGQTLKLPVSNTSFAQPLALRSRLNWRGGGARGTGSYNGGSRKEYMTCCKSL